jgi:hypothetical protein
VSASGTNVTLVDSDNVRPWARSAPPGNLSVTAGTDITNSGTVTVDGHHEPDSNRRRHHAQQRGE